MDYSDTYNVALAFVNDKIKFTNLCDYIKEN